MFLYDSGAYSDSTCRKQRRVAYEQVCTGVTYSIHRFSGVYSSFIVSLVFMQANRKIIWSSTALRESKQAKGPCILYIDLLIIILKSL